MQSSNVGSSWFLNFFSPCKLLYTSRILSVICILAFSFSNSRNKYHWAQYFDINTTSRFNMSRKIYITTLALHGCRRPSCIYKWASGAKHYLLYMYCSIAVFFCFHKVLTNRPCSTLTLFTAYSTTWSQFSTLHF